MKRQKSVIVAGHICLDITPVFSGKNVEHLEQILAPGKLVHMEGADVHTGGAVANTGLAMKLLGADVLLMGKIGRDSFGKMIQNILESYNVKEGMLISETESTSYSVILAIPGIDRIFLHHPGANDSFKEKEILQEELEKADLFHFGYPPLMKTMYEDNGEELWKLLKRVKAFGTATSLDMAAVDPDSAAGKADWGEILRRILPYVDFFSPSVEELCFMLDRSRFSEWKVRAKGKDITEILDIEKDVRPLAENCMKLGTKVLLIKCGAAGIYYRTASKKQLMQVGERVGLCMEEWACKEGFEKSYVPDVVRSGTGAGDTSIAAFLTAMLRGYSLERSIRLAAATGASCVAAYDALSGLKPFEELEQKIADGWKKRS